jgi:hypothetical protein
MGNIQDTLGFCSNDQMQTMPQVEQWHWVSETVLAWF